LLKRDKEGFAYFVDRIGDTFRWKSENVSTQEVSEVLSCTPGILEANVYGVKVPSHDGKAGMASLVTNSSFNTKDTYAQLTKELPVYAVPVFLRIQTTIDTTVTLKHKKRELMEEGYDPNIVKDPLYLLDHSTKDYIRIDAEIYRSVMNGSIRMVK